MSYFSASGNSIITLDMKLTFHKDAAIAID